MIVPHVQACEWPARDGRHFASLVRTGQPDGCRVALLGMPDDTGVRLNGGRVGAAAGPAAFRDALTRLGAAMPDGLNWPAVYDAGDVQPAGDDLEETHSRVTQAAGALIDAGLLPVGIGGGHDLTFAFVRAASVRRPRLAGISFDPHLDVREQTGSGMPMRALIERCGVRRVDLFGYSSTVNSAEHARWFIKHGGCIRGRSELQAVLEEGDSPLFATFDLDVIDMAFAPGVSAMNPAGWSSTEAAEVAREVGRCPRVVCFDVMELNPATDDRGRTARLAAWLFLAFLRGVAERVQ
ncbi:MAG: formimidoylglutamase [Phycisphaeraceae bacterium]|nr:formimidoylglutamase [Phycisphaeraceae bacterium]